MATATCSEMRALGRRQLRHRPGASGRSGRRRRGAEPELWIKGRALPRPHALARSRVAVLSSTATTPWRGTRPGHPHPFALESCPGTLSALHTPTTAGLNGTAREGLFCIIRCGLEGFLTPT